MSKIGAAAGMLLIAFALVRIIGHVVDLPALFSLLAPLLFAVAATLLLTVDVIDRASAPLAGLFCWPAADQHLVDFIPRFLGAATPPPRPSGA